MTAVASVPRYLRWPDRFPLGFTTENSRQSKETMMSEMSDSLPRAHVTSIEPVAQLAQSSRFAQTYVWIALLVACPLPNIIWMWVLGHPKGLPEEAIIRLFMLVVLGIVSKFVIRLQMVQGFLLSLVAFQFGIVAKAAFASYPLVANWLSTLAPVQYLLVDAILWVLFPVVFMSLTLIGSGLSRRDLYLTPGNMRARSTLFGTRLRAISWPWMISVLFVLLFGPFVLQILQIVRPDMPLTARILYGIPAILAFGIINGFQEEFRFRLVLLARLGSVVGPRQAVLLTAVLFGLSHWIGGHPNGPLGAGLVALAGWILGMSIIETKGVGWAWIVHALSDMVVATSLAMSTIYH